MPTFAPAIILPFVRLTFARSSFSVPGARCFRATAVIKTKAIAPVHIFGNACQTDRIHDLASRYNLHIVWDAAQAHGTSYKGKDVGGFDDIVCYSFYPTKNMFTGEGGMVTTNNPAFFDKIKFYPQQKSSVRRFRWPLGEEVFFENRLPGAYMEVPFEVEEKGIYYVLLYFTTHEDHAIVDVFLDGIPAARGFDTFSLAKMERQFSIGARDLEKGTHILKIVAVDNHKDAAIVYSPESGPVTADYSSDLEVRNIGYFIALDAIVLEKFTLGEGVSPVY